MIELLYFLGWLWLILALPSTLVAFAILYAAGEGEQE